MDQNHFLYQLVLCSFISCTCMPISKWAILAILNVAYKHSQVSSHQPLNLSFQNHHLKNPKWTFFLLQNNSQICPNSALKKNPKKPILHTQTCPICDLKHLAPKPKKLASKHHPHFALNLPNSRCQENYARWHIKEKKFKTWNWTLFLDSSHLLGFGIWANLKQQPCSTHHSKDLWQPQTSWLY